MEREEKAKKKNRTNPQYQWVAVVFCLSVSLSAVLSLLSETALDGAGYAVALGVLAVFIGLGIVFDIIGVAVTAADPRPFHSMAAHREKGAKEALFLLRNASRVSSVSYSNWVTSKISPSGLKVTVVPRSVVSPMTLRSYMLWPRSNRWR